MGSLTSVDNLPPAMDQTPQDNTTVKEQSTARSQETSQTQLKQQANINAVPTHAAVPSGVEAPSTTIIIVGAGPTGLLLSLLLAQKGIRSTVLDKDEKLNSLPRAVAFSGSTHDVFREVGIYDLIVKDAGRSPGFSWRKLAQDDGHGGKKLGERLAEWRLGEPNADGTYNPGEYVLLYPQNKIGKLLLGLALESSLVTVHWGAEVYDLEQDADGVVAHVRSNGKEWKLHGQYLAGCDGGQSAVRRLMKVNFYGHSWRERFMTTDVLRTPPVVEENCIDYIVDPEYWAITVPLEVAKAGTPAEWRLSMAITNNNLSDEEVTTPEFINELLLKHVDGPRPADFKVLRTNMYRMHQLLASTMYRGRCFLVGDAAHLTNPIGGLGLCTGILDADALAQALDLALNHHPNDPELQKECFKTYSASRRRVFQTVVHPYSSAAKTRLHSGDPDDVVEEDWYLRTLRAGDKAAIDQMHDGLLNHWRTNIRAEIAASKTSKT